MTACLYPSLLERDTLPGLQVARAVAAQSSAYFHSWVALVRFPKGHRGRASGPDKPWALAAELLFE
jgi:peptidoglycan/LPS O-acetylase OafA/YrhL